MVKPISIVNIHPYTIVCKFSNGEIRSLSFESASFENDKYFKKIKQKNVFSKVKIGELGQLIWADIAFMKDEEGNIIECEYDLSPEYVYFNSVSIQE